MFVGVTKVWESLDVWQGRDRYYRGIVEIPAPVPVDYRGFPPGRLAAEIPSYLWGRVR